MSVELADVNLAGKPVNATGILDFSTVVSNTGISFIPNKQATLRLHNESGSGLGIALESNGNLTGNSFNLPAGGWVDCHPKSGDTGIQYTVKYVMTNPQVTLLQATYYYPGEIVPDMPILGNSPVGGTTTGSVVVAQILDNEEVAGTEMVIGKPLGDVLHAVSITNNAVVRFGDATNPGSFTENGPASFNNGVTIALGLNTDTLEVSAGPANILPDPTSINGGTSGTATAYMDLNGTIKRCLVSLSNFRTGASVQNLSLPTAFTGHLFARTGVMGISTTPTGIQFLKSGVAQSMRIYATPSANGDSGVGPNTTLYGGSWGEIQAGSGIDTISFLANWGAAFTGLIELEGF